ncbi:MAG: heme ABC exporter ATP-binding protein CcmA [Alphaproteobacteria bacterium]|nr:heme ABC exporter ATP-binding protein CcmA [Alphaproteobacteria bacterium]
MPASAVPDAHIPDAPLLEARDLACRRGDRLVFAGLSFRLGAGGALLLVGPNGAGKSSLLRLLAGLTPPAAGALLWDGAEALADRAAHARRLAFIGHLDALKPALTAAETLAFDAALHVHDDGPTQPPAKRVLAALAAFRLDHLAELPVRLLSAGQKRRLALARLLLRPLPLWLLDEPTIALDAQAIEDLGAVLAAHRARGGMVVASSHVALPFADAERLDLGEAAALAAAGHWAEDPLGADTP